MQGQDTRIHPSAIIDPGASVADDVRVGAYAVIGAGVEVGSGSEVMHHASLMGPTRIGRNNRIYPYASLGHDPQDKKYDGTGTSALEIGDGNVIREFVTINRGSPTGGGKTHVGNNNWIMAYCHIAHDCHVGSNTVFANCSTLGGHATVQDNAILGGFTAVHQFCSVGELVITGGHTMIAQDVTPFVNATGNRAKLYGVNRIGLERNGYSAEEIKAIERAYRLFFRGKLRAEEALRQIEQELSDFPAVGRFVSFVRASTRGICR